uniref:RING-type domain-containing protein n=1 Tax=Arcella intermedia TaxID=1963864 RepID=A0A6B2LAC8_9EUKA|eukprot:TRINITY_DN3462_c0_g1_i1.p1 TRINITY_DN3462_c0_g1~~TRINITY_DN3462_c0_g1_i1.p1  ORF type:complete len:317 (-),score=87.11 TRINITY_DN3462_c0_g1_i1:133-1083(-)
MQSIKVVVVGDGAVGKTTFLISLTLGCFPTDYIPTTLDNYNAVYPLEGRNISLGLWDTAGQSDFDNLRPISYKSADVVLLFYSVVNPTSAENIKEKWLTDARMYCPDVPFFLIGTQIDQRENQKILHELQERNLKPLTKADGKKLAKEINAITYMECSAKDNATGYRDIFDEVLRYVICANKQCKKYGKHCWSIDCLAKMTKKVKCQGRCKHFFCEDCVEVWDDGWKGCPQCIIYEREARQQGNKKIGAVKKPRIPPSVRAVEQLEKEKIKEEKELKKAEKLAKKYGHTSMTDPTENTEKSQEKKKEEKYHRTEED